MPNGKYDAIVIGARCAGSPTAMLLARKGWRVLLVDKATFPSDTLSSHYIHQPGVACLRQWGLLERVAASGCPPVRRLSLDFGDVRFAGSPPAIDGVSEGYSVRRTVLDTILVEAAAESGAEVRQAFTVQSLLRDESGQVVGIRGHTRQGGEVEEYARIVIGADGMNSLVAREVEAEEYQVVPTLTCNYYTYWEGLDIDSAELYIRDGRFLVAVPTNGGATVLNVVWPAGRFAEVRERVEQSYMESLELAPGLAERVAGAKRVERFHGTGVQPNFFRKAYGPGWALVGDAGCHKDPILAQGITDAFHDVQFLTEALDAIWSGRSEWNEAMAQWQRKRDEAIRPLYDLGCVLGRLEPPLPPMQALHKALERDSAEADRYAGAMAGTIPVAEFFAPANLERIVNRYCALTSKT